MRVAVRVDVRESLTTVYAHYTGNNSVLNSIAPNTKWGMFSRVVGRVANIFALLDGFQKLSQVVRNARLGLPYTAQLVAGGLMITGAIVGILVASFVGAVVGVLIALAGLILGAIFVTLVPPAVIMWLNRSYFRNEGVGDLLPFDNLEEEKNSLEMVFKGITVEFVVGYTTVDMQDPDMFTQITHSMGYAATGSMMNSQPQEPAWDIDIKVKFPNFDRGKLFVNLKSSQKDDLLNVYLENLSDGEKSYSVVDNIERIRSYDKGSVVNLIDDCEVSKEGLDGCFELRSSVAQADFMRPFELLVKFSPNDIHGGGGSVQDSFEV